MLWMKRFTLTFAAMTGLGIAPLIGQTPTLQTVALSADIDTTRSPIHVDPGSFWVIVAISSTPTAIPRHYLKSRKWGSREGQEIAAR